MGVAQTRSAIYNMYYFIPLNIRNILGVVTFKAAIISFKGVVARKSGMMT